MDSPRLSIVLINYRYFKDLRSCIGSILESRLNFPTEVIVVNVPSNDGTEQLIEKLQRESHPFISFKLLEAPEFSISGLRNRGIRKAMGNFILLMDTDLTLDPQALQNAMAFMVSHPSVGVAGFNLYHEDGSNQFNGRTFPTPLTILARRSPLGKIFPGIERRHLYYDRDQNKNLEVDWVSGATMLIRREVIEKVGLLDERFRYGFEDVDFCYRVKKSGWKIYVIANATGIHREMRRSTRSLWFAYHHLRSAALFFTKHGWRAIFGKI